jgi:hypothetical protein
MEWRGQEVGSQAAASGALFTSRLVEEEMMRHPFDEGVMKRRRRRTDSATRAQRRVAHGGIRCGGVTGGWQ